MFIKKLACCLTALVLACCAYAESRKVTVKVTDIKKTGPIYVAAYLAAEGTQTTEPAATATATPEKKAKECSLDLTLEDGPYIIMVLQDLNENGQMDLNVLKMPKEPYGFSGYTGGIPSDMSKFIVNVASDMTVEIGLH